LHLYHGTVLLAFFATSLVTERLGFRVPRHPVSEPREGINMKTFIKMLKDQSGASAAEYALILAIVGSGIAIAALILGGAIGGAMNSASNCINLATTAACQ
jgi:pilus assembly protein Flp/PilA